MPDHSCSAPLFGSFGDGWASFFVTDPRCRITQISRQRRWATAPIVRLCPRQIHSQETGWRLWALLRIAATGWLSSCASETVSSPMGPRDSGAPFRRGPDAASLLRIFDRLRQYTNDVSSEFTSFMERYTVVRTQRYSLSTRRKRYST